MSGGIEIVPTMINGELRIRDVDLGARLGFTRPADFRKLLDRHKINMKKISQLATVARWVDRPQGGRVQVDDYYLDRKQAIFITAKSETAEATDITIEIIEKFDAYERGTQKSAPGLDMTSTLLSALKDTGALQVALKVVLDEREALKCEVATLASENAEMAPKVDAFELIAASEGLMSHADVAKTLQLKQKPFFSWCRDKENKWTFRREGCTADIAYQQRIDAGLLVQKTFTRTFADGKRITRTRPMVTPKGAAYLAKIFSKPNDKICTEKNPQLNLTVRSKK